MKLELTIKVKAESRKELEQLGGIYETTRTHIEQLHTEGYFGDPNQVELRWLIVGGRWFPQDESIAGVEAPLEPVTVIEVPNNGQVTPEETFP